MTDTRSQNPSTPATGGEPRYARTAVATRVGIHVRTIRRYEDYGLLAPHRTSGGYPLYSDADIDELMRIQRLTMDLGVNLAGVAAIQHLRRQLISMQQELMALRESTRNQM